MHASRWTTAAAGLLLLAGCAGFRGGWESLPYVGEAPPVLEPARTAYEAQQRSTVNLPGLQLGVVLHNQTRTYDTQVYLFALPLSVDPRTVQTLPNAPGMTRLSLRIVAPGGDFVFQPRRARLIVGGQAVNATLGREFGQWDAAGQRVSSGGQWAHRELGEEKALSEAGRSYHLSLDFPLPLPEPTRTDIVLDLAEALHAPGRPALPPIRFQPTRWKEGYT